MTEKEKGKRRDWWRYNNGQQPCVCLYYVLLTFVEVERIRQVHPWQTLMTSGEVPLLRAPKFSLSARILQETMSKLSQLCVCVCGLTWCMFFLQQPCAERETMHVH